MTTMTLVMILNDTIDYESKVAHSDQSPIRSLLILNAVTVWEYNKFNSYQSTFLFCPVIKPACIIFVSEFLKNGK